MGIFTYWITLEFEKNQSMLIFLCILLFFPVFLFVCFLLFTFNKYECKNIQLFNNIYFREGLIIILIGNLFLFLIFI